MAPAISTPVAPPPTIEGEEVLALGRVGGKLRALEGDEDAPPDAGGVLDALEARRHLGPFVVAEIRMGRAGGEHEVVVGDAHRIDLHEPLAGINGADFGQQHRRVLLLAQNVADRPGDVGRRERRGREW